MKNNKKNIALILAAGASSRFNDLGEEDICLPEKLKQYLIHEDKYLIQHSIDCFFELTGDKIGDKFEKILIAIRPEDNDFFNKEILKKYSEKEKDAIKICFGGKTRSESVFNGLKFISENFKEKFDYIVIHDGVRPFVKKDLIDSLFEKVINKNIDCAFPAIKVIDSVRLIKGDIFSTANRDNMYLVQTPQIFDFEKLNLCFNFEVKSYGEDEVCMNFYDEITMMEKYGGRIDFVKGHKDNIKVTFKDDLDKK